MYREGMTKLEALRAFREWLPTKRADFDWEKSCKCWMPMLYEFVTGFKGCNLGASVIAFNDEEDTIKRYASEYEKLNNTPFDEHDLWNFEFLRKDWIPDYKINYANKHYTIFDNGLAYIDEWVAHLESLEPAKPITYLPNGDTIINGHHFTKDELFETYLQACEHAAEEAMKDTNVLFDKFLKRLSNDNLD